MKRFFTFLVLALFLIPAVNAQVSVAFQGFEAGNTWTISSGSNISSTSGSSDTPSNQRIRTGSNSHQTINTIRTLTLDGFANTTHDSRFVDIWVSSTAGTGGNGADGADYVEVYAASSSSFGGTPDITISGNSNVRHGMNGTGVVSTTAGTPVTFTYPSGGDKTGNDAKSKIRINIPDAWTSVHLKIKTKNNSDKERWNIDDIELLGTLASSNDTDSDVDGPALGTQPDPLFISSLVDTDGEAVHVFDFEINDYGTSDGLSTQTTQVTIKAGANNDVDWTTQIANVKLSNDGGTTFATLGSPIISASQIVIPVTSGLDVADTDSDVISLFIYLKTSGLTDDGVLEFKVDTGSHGFTANAAGSQFTATLSGAISNEILIDVEATELLFQVQPSNVNIAAVMSPAATVSATDVNGNIDINYSTNVSLSTTGTFDGAATTSVSPSSGIATFNNLIFSVAGTGLTLSASSGALTGVTSNTFDVTTLPVAGDIIITEIMQNPAAVSDSNGEWFEVYNTTGSSIDLNGWIISSAGNSDHTISSSTIVTAGGYAVFGKNDNMGTNGGVTVDYEYTSISLSNTSDDISIKNGITTIDNVAWDNGATFPNPTGASMTLKSSAFTHTANDTGSNWCEASSTYGSGDKGTPNSTNDSCTKIAFDLATSEVLENTATHTVDVTLTNYETTAVTISISSIDGSATAADYSLSTTSLTFSANETKTISISITNDAITEGAETFDLSIAITSGSASLGLSTHTVTILDDDIPTIDDVRINELDSHPSNHEFVELFGTANFSLDGLVLVFFNGGSSNNPSYITVNLDGSSLDANGFFLVGDSNAATPDPDKVITASIQNGVDAVGLYFAAPADFPTGTAPTTTNLIDALVYDTGMDDDVALRTALGFTAANGHADNPINETEHGADATESVQRGSWFTAPRTPRAVNAPLPIELLSFTAKAKATTTLLQWQTATEIHNDYMAIEHSTDGRIFTEIGRVQGAGTSYETNNYSFVDEKPKTGINYYRLRQIDYDGKAQIHKTVSVFFGENGGTVHVYPTGVTSELNIILSKTTTTETQLVVIDVTGKEWLRTTLAVGQSQHTLDVSSLVAGQFFLQVQNAASVEVARFVKL